MGTSATRRNAVQRPQMPGALWVAAARARLRRGARNVPDEDFHHGLLGISILLPPLDSNHGLGTSASGPIFEESEPMQVFQNQGRELQSADPETFIGKALYGLVADSKEGEGLRVYDVRFQPGARTNWHRHSGVQLLLVQEGQGYVQKEGHKPTPIVTGDVVLIRPGERHWHGASAGHAMGHLAVNVAAQTEWLEPVSDDDYPL